MYSVCLLSLRAIFMPLCCVLFLPCNLCVVLFLCLIICNDPQLWTHAVYTLFVCPLRRFLLISRTSCAATQDLVKGWMKRIVSLVLSTRQKRLKQRLWFPTPKTLKTVFLFLRQQSFWRMSWTIIKVTECFVSQTTNQTLSGVLEMARVKVVSDCSCGPLGSPESEQLHSAFHAVTLTKCS